MSENYFYSSLSGQEIENTLLGAVRFNTDQYLRHRKKPLLGKTSALVKQTRKSRSRDSMTRFLICNSKSLSATRAISTLSARNLRMTSIFGTRCTVSGSTMARFRFLMRLLTITTFRLHRFGQAPRQPTRSRKSPPMLTRSRILSLPIPARTCSTTGISAPASPSTNEASPATQAQGTALTDGARTFRATR